MESEYSRSNPTSVAVQFSTTVALSKKADACFQGQFASPTVCETRLGNRQGQLQLQPSADHITGKQRQCTAGLGTREELGEKEQKARTEILKKKERGKVQTNCLL